MSEVARLMQQIEMECEAMKRAMEGFAVMASHKAITARYDRLGRHQAQLEKYVGAEEANRLVYETYDRVIG